MKLNFPLKLCLKLSNDSMIYLNSRKIATNFPALLQGEFTIEDIEHSKTQVRSPQY